MSPAEHILVKELKEKIQESVKIGCTECRYCMPCPQGVDIPGVFRCYNHMWTENKSAGRHEYMQTVGLRKESASPAKCVACGRCEKQCPQHLPIIHLLKEADRALNPPHYRLALAVGRRFLLRGTGR